MTSATKLQHLHHKHHAQNDSNITISSINTSTIIAQPSASSKAWRKLRKYSVVILAAILATSSAIATSMVQATSTLPNGTMAYNIAGMNFMVETVKCLYSASLLVMSIMQTNTIPSFSWRENLSLIVPQFLYTINNYVYVVLFQHWQLHEITMLLNMRIVTMGIMSWLFLSRRFRESQILALILLSLAGVILDAEKGMCKRHHHHIANNHTRSFLSNSIGSLLVIVYSVISAVSGVYTEKVLKRRKTTSVHFQNVQFYMYGMLFSGMSVFVVNASDRPLTDGFHSGVWCMIFIYSGTGTLNGIVMKWFDNIVRLQVQQIAVLLGVLASVFLLRQQLTLLFILSFIVATISIRLYHLDDINDSGGGGGSGGSSSSSSSVGGVQHHKVGK